MKAIYEYEVKHGAAELFGLQQNKSRLYTLHKPVEIHVSTDSGLLIARTESGFRFDGRSGPSIIDWYAPNLGSFEERCAWLLHDALAYAGSLSFYDTNLFLKLWLRDVCAYNPLKAEIIRRAVSISKSWYGDPTPDDPFYKNRFLVTTIWSPNG